MDESTLYAKEMIKNQVNQKRITNVFEPFSKYSKGYLWTNENIKEYINKKYISEYNSALSVTASGDHLFNLILNNVLNIDTFDTNTLTEYNVLGLKKALIEKFKYNDFLTICELIANNMLTLEETTYLIKDLLPLMDKKYRKYWQNISEYNYQLQKNNDEYLDLFAMLFINITEKNNFIRRNSYLVGKDNYDKFKENMMRANINFYCTNAINILDTFPNQKYDVILLSNILDYITINWNYEQLRKFEDELLFITNNNGKIFLAYLLNYYNKNNKNIFRRADIKKEELINEIIIELKEKDYKHNDAVILIRK